MSREELLADAVQVLTRAARESGDFADFLAAATAGAAANVGGTETLLEGRPGSWEADFTRQLVAGTVGWEGEYLLEHRTEPVTVEVFVDEILYDLGPGEAYEQARAEIDRRVDALEDLDGDDAPAHEALAELEDRLEAQRAADWDVYGQAVATAIRAIAEARGIHVPVLIEVVDDEYPRTYDERVAATDRADRLGLDLLDRATAAVPLPGGGRPPLERLEAGGSLGTRPSP